MAEREGLLGPDRIELLDSWKSGHSGFSAHNQVTVLANDPAGLERLARYLLRPSLSIERLELDGAVVRCRHKRTSQTDGEPFDPLDFLARLLMHAPEPRLHSVRYYGWYSNLARARRGRPEDDSQINEQDQGTTSPDQVPSSAERKRPRRKWAQLIRRIYEADPLLSRMWTEDENHLGPHRSAGHRQDHRPSQSQARGSRASPARGATRSLLAIFLIFDVAQSAARASPRFVQSRLLSLFSSAWRSPALGQGYAKRLNASPSSRHTSKPRVSAPENTCLALS